MTPIETLQSEIEGFRKLGAGWDGESAEKPNEASIKAAILYVDLRSDLAGLCEAALHVDGSVMLEADDDSWTVRFASSGSMVVAGKPPPLSRRGLHGEGGSGVNAAANAPRARGEAPPTPKDSRSGVSLSTLLPKISDKMCQPARNALHGGLHI
ncbi:hypothetical protein [Methylobacterium sp. sgz302541]|uniref:hypothetical protein n=1 Tax=unclassified Methylobacterium TaxID=2615210 RepID=UPI003D32C409